MGWEIFTLPATASPALTALKVWGGVLISIPVICLMGHFFWPVGWTETGSVTFWQYTFGILLLIWTGLFGFKLLLYGNRVSQYNQTIQIRKDALAARQSWASRYLMVINSTVYLPEGLTASSLINPAHSLEVRYNQVNKLTQFPDLTIRKIILSLLSSISSTLSNLPNSFKPYITVISLEEKYDVQICDAIRSALVDSNGEIRPEQSIKIVRALPQTILNDWIKSSEENVNILLALQFPIMCNCSEMAAIFVFVSDDWADDHKLSGKAKVYRTMDAISDDFQSKYSIMLNMQTVSRQANKIWLADMKSNEFNMTILQEHRKYIMEFLSENIIDFEKFVGKTGPLGGWMALGVAADIAQHMNENQIVLGRWEENWVVNAIQSSEVVHNDTA